MRRRYECSSCKGVSDVPFDQRLVDIKCCKNPTLKLIGTEMDEDPRIVLGNAYEEILDILDTYMDMPLEQRKLVALWIIGTYYHDKFNTYPFLFINAMKGSGKTRLLKIISHLARGGQGHVHTGIREATLFRMKKHDTLVLDELESIAGKDKGELREYLNACYKRGGVVQRMKKVKEEWVVETFEPYKPIAMANIYGMNDVLGDRCISFVLEKSDNPSKTKIIEDFDSNTRFIKLTELLSVVCAVSVNVVSKKHIVTAWNDWIKSKYNYTNYNNTLTTLTTLNTLQIEEYEELFLKLDELNVNGRNLELLFPLVLTANDFSKDLILDMLKFGKEIMDEKSEEELNVSVDVSLYEYVASKENGLEYKNIKDITREFRLWHGEEDWLNERWVGRALKRLGLRYSTKRVASGMMVILNVSKAREKVKMFQKGGKDG